MNTFTYFTYLALSGAQMRFNRKVNDFEKIKFLIV